MSFELQIGPESGQKPLEKSNDELFDKLLEVLTERKSPILEELKILLLEDRNILNLALNKEGCTWFAFRVSEPGKVDTLKKKLTALFETTDIAQKTAIAKEIAILLL